MFFKGLTALSKAFVVSVLGLSLLAVPPVVGMVVPDGALGAVPALPPGFSGSETCWQLWYQRNRLFAEAGYCFQSPLGREIFGTPCRTVEPVLTESARAEVERLQALEAAQGCASNTGQAVAAGGSPRCEAASDLDIAREMLAHIGAGMDEFPSPSCGVSPSLVAFEEFDKDVYLERLPVSAGRVVHARRVGELGGRPQIQVVYELQTVAGGSLRGLLFFERYTREEADERGCANMVQEPQLPFVYRDCLFPEGHRPPARDPRAASSPTLRDGEIFQDPLRSGGWGPAMVVVPSGTFVMGSPPSEPGRRDNEGPQRRVTVPRFAIGRFEVTYADWSACVFDGGCRTVAYFSDTPSRDRLPVSRVTWERAREYAAWLSRQTGQRYRLPTEAEWEYAARAGSTTAYSRGDRIDAHQARFDADEAGLVGQFPPNAWGLHDVHGNVQEWTADCASESYAGLPVDGTAYQPVECHMRIARGGSWQDAEENLRSAARAVLYPVADFGIGIRLVREL